MQDDTLSTEPQHLDNKSHSASIHLDSINLKAINLKTIGQLSTVPLTAAALSACDETVVEAYQKVYAKFLQQAGLSSTTLEINEVIALGYEGWINVQLNKKHQESTWDWMVTNGYDNGTYMFNNKPLFHCIWRQLFEAKDVLRKRMALALSEIFVINIERIGLIYRPFAGGDYWDMLNNMAFGNYRDLLKTVTLTPLMGLYLNTRGNSKANPRYNSSPDENYARELMQLFSIGLYELNLDGTIKTDSNNKPLETYNQDDVLNLARVFTGWEFNNPEPDEKIPPPYIRKPMIMLAKRHSELEANFLGGHIPANTDGETALEMALDIIFQHPNVAPFISKQLIQRFVTSNPSSAYIERVARVFNNNGNGVKGDLGAVIKTILLDKEARLNFNNTDNSRGKVKEPMLRLVQWGRTFKAKSYSGKFEIGSLANSDEHLGQTPFTAPSVFNFFRPGYVPPNTPFAEEGLVAPELQLVNIITAASYINYMSKVVQYGAGAWAGPIRKFDVNSDYKQQLALVNDVPALIKQLNLELTASQIDEATIARIISAVESINSGNDWEQRRIYAAISLIMALPEYLVLK